MKNSKYMSICLVLIQTRGEVGRGEPLMRVGILRDVVYILSTSGNFHIKLCCNVKNYY